MAVVMVSVVAAFGVIAATQTASGAVKTVATYTSQGAYSWVVPTGVTKVTFTMYGASGGNEVGNNTILASGGAGGETKASFAVQPGQVFEIVVGGRGGDGGSGIVNGSAGYNGGLAGNGEGFGLSSGGGGGGGSDVRLGASKSGCMKAVPPNCGYEGRIVVAGGGSGAMATTTGLWADGGAGGGRNGGNGSHAGPPNGATATGGSQTSGGQSAGGILSQSGLFGTGGAGDIDHPTGGTGGGWFAGGGGSYDLQGVPLVATDIFTAGGGSGYISGLALSGSFPGGTHYGDGEVIVQTS